MTLLKLTGKVFAYSAAAHFCADEKIEQECEPVMFTGLQ
jgi:hypothetical protein